LRGYTVAGQDFRTQQDLLAYVRAILNRYHLGQVLDLFDYPFVIDLLQQHPDAAQKIGCGASHIYVAETPAYHTRCFHLVRQDGSETDFSYLECIRATAHDKKVRQALRYAIAAQIFAYKRAAFDASPIIICPDTGERLAFMTAHVDHRAPLTFERLVADFLAAEGLTFEAIDLIPQADLAYRDELADAQLCERWLAYHLAHAELEIISPTANLSLRTRNS